MFFFLCQSNFASEILDYIGALQLSEAPFLRALAGSQLMEGSLAIALSPQFVLVCSVLLAMLLVQSQYFMLYAR